MYIYIYIYIDTDKEKYLKAMHCNVITDQYTLI